MSIESMKLWLRALQESQPIDATDVDAFTRSVMAIESLRQAIEQAQKQIAELAPQEPVIDAHTAWDEGFNAGNKWRQDVTRFWENNDYGQSPAQPENPHTSPAPMTQSRKPLTEGEIMKACNAVGFKELLVKIARIVEADHGITSFKD